MPRVLCDASRNLHSRDYAQGLPSLVPDWKTSRSFPSPAHVSWREGSYYTAGGTCNDSLIITL